MNRQVLLIFCVWLAAHRAVADHVVSGWNGGTGNWSTAANWSPNNFFPNNGNGGNTYDAGISEGTVTLDQDIAVQDFYLSGNVVYGPLGTLTATSPYTLTVNGAMTWNYTSTMSGAGQTVIAPTGSLSLIGGFDHTHLLNRQLVNNGTTTSTGLTALYMNGGTFTNNGSFTANVGVSGQSEAIFSGTGGTNAFNNYGTFTKLGDGSTVFGSGGSDLPFNNYGTVDIQAGGLRLETASTVTSHTGDFAIAGGAALRLSGTHSFAASSNLSGSGTLYLRNATANIDGPQTFAGRLYFESGGTANINSNSTIGGVSIISTSNVGLGGTGTVTLTGASDWLSGTMSGTGQTVIAPDATMVIEGPSPVYANSGYANLRRQLVNNGHLSWSTYNFGLTFQNGTLTNNGTFTADVGSGYGQNANADGGTNAFNNVGTFIKQGEGFTSLSVPFNNSGMVEVQGGTLSLESVVTQHDDILHRLTGGKWRVGPGATLNITTGSNITTNLADVTLDGLGSSFAKINTSLLNNQGRFSILNGRDFTAGGVFSNAGELIVGADSMFSAPSGLSQLTGGELTGGSWHITGTLTTGGVNITTNRASLTLNGSQANFSQANAISDNRGTLAILNGRNQSFSAGPFSNTGLVLVSGGGSTLHLNSLGQINAGELTEGAWYIGNDATLQIDNGTNITTNRATVTLAGANSSFNKLDSLVNNYGVLEILSGRNFTAQAAFNNYGTLSVGAGSTFSAPSGFTNHEGATLKGTGTYQANVTNSGRLAPGNSPGIMTINGNYSQTSSGTLEIEFGGTTLTPDVLHDKLIVSGTATLGGRLEVPIVNIPNSPPFLPQVNDTITFLTAASVSGVFKPVAPNLAAFNAAHASDPGFIPKAFILEYYPTEVKLRVAERSGDNDFVSVVQTANWSDTANTWSAHTLPQSNNVVEIQNLYSAANQAQLVNVDVVNAEVYDLSVADSTDSITVNVQTGKNLTAATDIVVGSHGAIKLQTSSTLNAVNVTLQGGGQLSGNGTVGADLAVTSGTLSPGFSVGHLDVDGDYQQGAAGTLAIDVDSVTQFDSVDVAGSVQLGGKLRIDASNLATLPAAGTLFPIITADSISGTFASVESSGNSDVYFLARTVGPTAFAMSLNRGDMNGDTLFNSTDADLFVFGLMNESSGKWFAKCGDQCMANSDHGAILPHHGGDFSLNGWLDFADIAGFQNYGAGAGMGAGFLAEAFDRYFASVPEPASGTLLVLAGVVVSMTNVRIRHCNGREAHLLNDDEEDVQS